MENRITYHWGEKNVLIDLGYRVHAKVKLIIWAEFVLLFLIATSVLLQSVYMSESYLRIIGTSAAGIIYCIAGYRFLTRTFYSEKLLLTPDTIDIIQRTPFKITSHKYEWQFMGPLHYIGKAPNTEQLLKNYSRNNFTIEYHERVLNRIIIEDNLYFNYGGFPVRFGKSLYSWDAEEVVNIMQLYIGNKLVLGPEWQQMVQEHETGDFAN